MVFGLTLPLSAQTKALFEPPEGGSSPYLNPPAAAHYCKYVSGVATSQAAILESPILFGSFGSASAEILPSPVSATTSTSARRASPSLTRAGTGPRTPTRSSSC